MPDMGAAVSRGRAVKEGIGRLALALFDRFFKDVVFLPEFQYFLLARDKVQRGRYFSVHN